MSELPPAVWLLLAVIVGVVSVPGLRGMLAVHAALRLAEFDRRGSARALAGGARPGSRARGHPGAVRHAASWAYGLIGGRHRDGGRGLRTRASAARIRAPPRGVAKSSTTSDCISICSRWPWSPALPGRPRSRCASSGHPMARCSRAWQRVCSRSTRAPNRWTRLRSLEQRLRLPAARHAGERLRPPRSCSCRPSRCFATVRARSAASRFARAERKARAAPLKLWAAMLLCLVPCTAVVLAFPLARLLVRLLG